MYDRLAKLTNFIESKQSFFLLGPRGSGKSSLIRHYLNTDFAENEKFEIDLLKNDEFVKYTKSPQLLRQEVAESIKNLLAKSYLIIFIDEIQKIPSLLDEVHWMIEHFQEKVIFILSGSSARKLKRSGVNLLGGRALHLQLFPFQYLEIKQDFKLETALQFGTLPKVWTSKNDFKANLLKAYVELYLKEEIKDESLTRNLGTFAEFLEIAAQMNGEIVNYSKLGKQIGLSHNTIKEYFQILLDTLIVIKMNGWSRSKRKQLQVAPRFYFFDNGVCNTLRHEINSDIVFSSKRVGKLFENFIINEINRYNIYKNLDLNFHYWRTSTNQEVDLIISRGSFEKVFAIEIKISEIIDESDLNSLKAFQEEEKKSELLVISRAKRAYSIDKIKIIPWESMFNLLDTLYKD
jgi:predicted AAA+ superfamily ATPase